MAYIDDPYDDQKKKAAQQGVDATISSGGQTAPVTGPGAPNPAPPTAPGFVNFQRIIGSNQAGAEALGSKIADTVSSTGKTAEEGQKKLQGDFNSRVAAGTPAAYYKPADASLLPPNPAPSQYKGADERGMPYEPPLGPTDEEKARTWKRDQELYDPHRLPTTSRADAEKGVAGKYAGPNSLADLPGFKKVFDDTLKAGRDSASANTDGGRQALIKKEVEGGNQSYTGGQNRLDAALVGHTTGGRFQELAAKYGGLNKNLSDALTRSVADSGAAKSRTAETVKKYQAILDEYDRIKKLKQTEDEAAANAPPANADTSNHIVAGQDPDDVSAFIAKYGLTTFLTLLGSGLGGPIGGAIGGAAGQGLFGITERQK